MCPEEDKPLDRTQKLLAALVVVGVVVVSLRYPPEAQPRDQDRLVEARIIAYPDGRVVTPVPGATPEAAHTLEGRVAALEQDLEDLRELVEAIDQDVPTRGRGAVGQLPPELLTRSRR